MKALSFSKRNPLSNEQRRSFGYPRHLDPFIDEMDQWLDDTFNGFSNT